MACVGDNFMKNTTSDRVAIPGPILISEAGQHWVRQSVWRIDKYCPLRERQRGPVIVHTKIEKPKARVLHITGEQYRVLIAEPY